jgi:hypothetical protein
MLENFWNLRVNDRLAQWKDFRRSLDHLPIDSAIEQVNQFWSRAPGVGYYLSPDDPKDWPDPWTLLAENYYCDIAKALGIVYTIYFTGHKNLKPEIRVYYDTNTKERSNVAWLADGKYILNFYPYAIVNTVEVEKMQLQLLYQYSSTDLQLEKY